MSDSSSSLPSKKPSSVKIYPVVILKNGNAKQGVAIIQRDNDDSRCYHRVKAVSREAAMKSALEQHKDPTNQLGGSLKMCGKNHKGNKDAYERDVENRKKKQAVESKKEKEKKNEKVKKRKRENSGGEKKPVKKKADDPGEKSKTPTGNSLAKLEKRVTELERIVKHHHPLVLTDLFGPGIDDI